MARRLNNHAEVSPNFRERSIELSSITVRPITYGIPVAIWRNWQKDPQFIEHARVMDAIQTLEVKKGYHNALLELRSSINITSESEISIADNFECLERFFL